MSENKRAPQFNNEHERFKLQIYADKTHAILTIGASLAFAFLSLISIFYVLFYEGVFGFNASQAITGWGGIFVIFILVMVTIVLFVRQYNKNSDRISDMAEFINEGNALPPLSELNKWTRKTDARSKLTSKEKGTNRYSVDGYIREVIIGIAIAVVVQGGYDTLNTAYNPANEWWMPILISLVIIVIIALALVIIWAAWGRKKNTTLTNSTKNAADDYSI